MRHNKTILLFHVILIFVFACLTSCNGELQPISSIVESVENLFSDMTKEQPIPAPKDSIIEFQVEIPGKLSVNDKIYLSVLDEVTGLALNAKHYPMQLINGDESSRQSNLYSVSLPFGIGSLVKYRYERESDSLRVSEHKSDGSPVRYRLYHAVGPGTVKDVVSRWTDTSFDSQTGRIMGEASDIKSGQPIPNLLITAGGAQTITTADGSFIIEGLKVIVWLAPLGKQFR